jgi:hypothetical protein
LLLIGDLEVMEQAVLVSQEYPTRFDFSKNQCILFNFLITF